MKKSALKAIISGISTAAVSAAAAMTVSAFSVQAADVVYGDANCDGKVEIADATLILQYLTNKDEYNLTDQGRLNSDCCNVGDGVTASDALSIQKLDAGVLTKLPESQLGGTTDPVTETTYIHLNGSSATIEGNYAEVDGSKITITHSGTFYVDGTLDDGQINVNIADEVADPETVKIFLNNANITGKSAPAILVTNAENTSLNIVDGTVNSISDGDTAYSGDYLGAAVIDAKDDITVKGGTVGDGILNITANTQDGLACNNDIKFTGGTVNITTLNATDKTDAVKGKTSVTVKDSAVLNIDAEGDGLKSSQGSVNISGGTTEIKAGNDAVQGVDVNISGGTLLGGGDRGITSSASTNITGGIVVVTATDNQTDQTLMTGTTQGTMLLNFKASAETDGCWKKANALVNDYVTFGKWTKKYAFALISAPDIAIGKSYGFTNASNSNTAVHSGGASFEQNSLITVYESVDPDGESGSAAVTPASGYTITLNGASVESSAPSDTASVNNGVLTIAQPGVFTVSGEAKEVQIVVNVDKTAYPDGVVELDLTGANISNSTTSPINVQSIGDEVQIVAKSGTVNTISDGTAHSETYTDSDGNVNTVEGAIFSRDDLKFKGTGSLTVNGNTDDAIVCKNDIKIYNGNLTVNAVDDGIRGKDSVTVGNSADTDFSTLKLTVKTEQGDGIKSTATDVSTTTKSYGVVTINGGTVDINACSDGIQGEQDVVINGGDINIYTYEGSTFAGSASGGSADPWGGSGSWGGGMQDGNSGKTDISAKGIKAVGLYDAAGTTWQSGGNITVNGGNITVDSSDDCIHCGGNITVNAGNFKLATADDALHADHDLTLGSNGGSAGDFGIYVTKCYEGVEGQNIYQYSGTVAVKSDDDGYNAAGGADGSGNTNPGGWNPGGGFGSSGNNVLEISGGIAIVQSANGDHDAFDSNGSLNITGGVVVANGQEPFDCDGTNSVSGGTVIAASSQSSGQIAENTRFTVADQSGNVIVSFMTMRSMGSITYKHTDGSGVTAYTGGTISGGTDLIVPDDSQAIYANGTISGGTSISAGSSSGGSQRPW